MGEEANIPAEPAVTPEAPAVQNSMLEEQPRFWNMTSMSETEGEIVLFGEVLNRRPVNWWTGEPRPGFYITPEGFMEDLEAVKNKSKITVKLNSVGGDPYTAIAIHNALKSLPGTVHMVVYGLAASAGGIIMCAGDTISVYPGSIIMLHEASRLLIDYYNITDLNKVIKNLDVIERAVADIYSAKTGKTQEEIRKMITEETWLTGREAVEKGFADVLAEEAPACMMVGNDHFILNGAMYQMKGLRPPQSLFFNQPKEEKKPESEKGGRQRMETTQELRQEYPQLVQQIEQEAEAAAVAMERERLMAIENIEAGVGDPELIRNAKYGETACTAAELALKAMQRQAELGQKHLENAQADYSASNAAEVGAAPNNGADENSDEADLMAVVEAYNKTTGGKING